MRDFTEHGPPVGEFLGRNHFTGSKLVGGRASILGQHISQSSGWPRQANGERLHLKHTGEGGTAAMVQERYGVTATYSYKEIAGQII